jgi:hypothetical protein
MFPLRNDRSGEGPVIELAFSVALAIAAQQVPGPASEGRSVIPSQFHGKWAPSARACRGSAATENIIEINGSGYSAFEDTTEAHRAGQVRNGTHYFRVTNRSLPEVETPGTLALRLTSRGLAMSSIVRSGTVHWSMVRCR